MALNPTACLRASIKPRLKVLQFELQERLLHKPRANIIHGSRNIHLRERTSNLLKRVVHARRIRDVRAESGGVSTISRNFIDDGTVVGRVTPEQGDGVGLGEFACDGGAL